MRFWKYTLALLLLVLAILAIALFQLPDFRFHIISCDVGQGDAILLTYRNYQILIDGGPDAKVLDCLGKHLPFWDREIELVILTHPDGDHFQGLIDVIRRYKIDNFLAPAITVSKPEYEVLEKEVGRGYSKRLYPSHGQVLKVGLIHLDILAPLEHLTFNNLQFTNGEVVTEEKTNDYSIVSLVSFGNFRALLAGDMTPAVSDGLAGGWADGPVNYIKIPHHGSKNGLTEKLLKVIVPKLAVISVGKNNWYGHPAPEILQLLKKYDAKVFRTDEAGDVEVITDGERYWVTN